MAYEERKYREYFKADGLQGFEVIESETDLFIFADTNLEAKALNAVMRCRNDLQKYILTHETFATTFSPIMVSLFSPKIVWQMAWAAWRAKVGPMAAVAGVIAELVGRDLLKHSKEVMVENGGDIFLKINKARKIGIYAGQSAFSEKIGLEIAPEDSPCGICTSSGTVGHSISLGKADAVTVIARSTALADAAATAIGNVVQDVATIGKGLEAAKKISGLDGVLIIKGDQMGAHGKVKICSI